MSVIVNSFFSDAGDLPKNGTALPADGKNSHSTRTLLYSAAKLFSSNAKDRLCTLGIVLLCLSVKVGRNESNAYFTTIPSKNLTHRGGFKRKIILS